MSKGSKRLALLCSISLLLNVSGCGRTIWDMLLNNPGQSERDTADCLTQCSGIKDQDNYRHCLQECGFNKSLSRRSAEEREKDRKKEKERAEEEIREKLEQERRMTEKIRKGLDRAP
ncbi:hypothetical protein [Desulfomonile tiedjei]|uniref:Uncharacterized protein n=1 Tax=Desulfomonile tiedjei (strain ATCC 49306 / DSM 6799 / DCB-1) TaxID=706587 RepID=I4BZZ0_DESTA|nr:hypothetical protein [Desulfomonile tiedjei]AFM22881.1 hypothetical protein Desti_0134 [Desulfomonile tiedjei DSM 6799]